MVMPPSNGWGYIPPIIFALLPKRCEKVQLEFGFLEKEVEKGIYPL